MLFDGELGDYWPDSANNNLNSNYDHNRNRGNNKNNLTLHVPTRASRLVLIGLDLKLADFEPGFLACQVKEL